MLSGTVREDESLEEKKCDCKTTRHLISSAIAVVNPPPGAHALAIRARGHISRYFEDCVTVPDTVLLNRENSKVLWADNFGIAGISNRKGTAIDIGMTSCM